MYFSEKGNVDVDTTLITIFLVSFNLQSCCLSLQSACSLQSAVCSLQSAVCSLRSANVIHRLPLQLRLLQIIRVHVVYILSHTRLFTKQGTWIVKMPTYFPLKYFLAGKFDSWFVTTVAYRSKLYSGTSIYRTSIKRSPRCINERFSLPK